MGLSSCLRIMLLLCSSCAYFAQWTSMRGSVWILSTRLAIPNFCAWPKPGPWFPSTYVFVLFVFKWFKVVVRFVDIGGNVDHHCFLFIIITSSEITWPYQIQLFGVIYWFFLFRIISLLLLFCKDVRRSWNILLGISTVYANIMTCLKYNLSFSLKFCSRILCRTFQVNIFSLTVCHIIG